MYTYDVRVHGPVRGHIYVLEHIYIYERVVSRSGGSTLMVIQPKTSSSLYGFWAIYIVWGEAGEVRGGGLRCGFKPSVCNRHYAAGGRSAGSGCVVAIRPAAADV